MEKKLVDIQKAEALTEKLRAGFSDVSVKIDNGVKRVFYKDTEKFGVSVTKFVESFSQPFDSEKWSVIKAAQLGVTKETILDRWRLTALKAQLKGTLLHSYMENVYKGADVNWRTLISDEIRTLFLSDVDYLKSFEPMIKSVDRFVKEHPYLIPIASEKPVGDTSLGLYYRIDSSYTKALELIGVSSDIQSFFVGVNVVFTDIYEFISFCGSVVPSHYITQDLIDTLSSCALKKGMSGIIDHLFYDRELEGLIIVDWKQGKPIEKTNKWANMLGHFSRLPDCNFYKYSLQLSCYKLILKRVANIRPKGLFLVHFGEDYAILKAADLSSDVAELF